VTEELASAVGKWRGIPVDRVVAIVADLEGGLTQVGSGYLVTGRRVLTAYHCTVDATTGQPATSLRIVRRSDGMAAQVVVVAAALDAAVLEVDDAAWPPMLLEPVKFGRVDRSHSSELHNCQAVGFPAWQMDPKDQGRNAAELHGTIRATEGVESGYLVMRDPDLDDVAVPTSARGGNSQDSPWGGLSGALVFHQGLALGVIVEHRPRQGRSALQILPMDRLSATATTGEGALSERNRVFSASSNAESDVNGIAAALILPPSTAMRLAEDPNVPSSVTRSPEIAPLSGAEPAGGTITADVIMRGPLQAMDLADVFDEAVTREQTDPASAARTFVEVAEQLSAKGFDPHADAIRRRAIQAYAAAGCRSDAVRLQLQLANDALLAGRWSDASILILALRQLMGRPDEAVSADLTAAGAALQTLSALLEDPVLATENVSAVLGAIHAHLQAVLDQLVVHAADFTLLLTVTAITAVTAAEVALAAEVPAPVISSATFDQIIEALGSSSNVPFARLRIRLRLAMAEAQDPNAEESDKWQQLRQEATDGRLSADNAALIFGRYARTRAIAAAPAEADMAWRYAVEFGGRIKLFSDTADWLSAQWRLRHRYGPIDLKEIQDLGQMIQLLAKQESDWLIPVGDAHLECLEAMRRDDQGLRSAALAAQRLRVLSAAAGLWEEELQAHRLLADIFERSGEPALAAFHRVRAGEAPPSDVAARVTAGFIDVSRELRRHAPAERAAAYAMLAAQGNLIPDSLVDLIGSHAAEDLEAVKDGRITETLFAGPGVLRSATDAVAAVAARLTPDIAERLMSALDGRLTADKGTFAWTDESHFKLLATLAASDNAAISVSALERLSRLMSIESPALRGGGRSLGFAVRRRPADVRRILVLQAQDGNDEGAELLTGWSLTGSPGRRVSRDSAEQSAWLAALPFAEEAAERLAAAPAGTPGSASLFVHLVRDATLVTILDPSDIDQALTGLLRVAADNLHLSATRQQALDAASILVAGETGNGLGSDRLSEVFGIACEYARGEHDGSAMDDLTNSAHPLSSWRVNMGDATLVGGGLHLAARAARGDDQRIAVLELAGPMVRSEPSESVLHDIGRALAALGSLDGGPDLLSIGTLAKSPSPSLRAVSAVYWAKVYGPATAASDPTDAGADLVHDTSLIVRRSLVAQLANAAADSGLSSAGRGVVDALARDPMADIREAALAIHAI
jgi:hypothetical protein